MDENPEHRSDELQGMLSALTQRKSYFTAQPESDILPSQTFDTSLMETSGDRSGHISQSVSILADIRLLKERVAGLRCGVRTGVAVVCVRGNACRVWGLRTVLSICALPGMFGLDPEQAAENLPTVEARQAALDVAQELNTLGGNAYVAPQPPALPGPRREFCNKQASTEPRSTCRYTTSTSRGYPRQGGGRSERDR